jgi:hypothetical protein
MTTYFLGERMTEHVEAEGSVTPRPIVQSHSEMVSEFLKARTPSRKEFSSNMLRKARFADQLDAIHPAQREALALRQDRFQKEYLDSCNEYMRIRIGDQAPGYFFADPRFVDKSIDARRKAVSDGHFQGVEIPTVNQGAHPSFACIGLRDFSPVKKTLVTSIESPRPRCIEPERNPQTTQNMLIVVIVGYGCKIIYDRSYKQRSIVLRWIKKIFE